MQKQPHQLTKTEIRERQIKDSIAAKKKQTDTLLAENHHEKMHYLFAQSR